MAVHSVTANWPRETATPVTGQDLLTQNWPRQARLGEPQDTPKPLSQCKMPGVPAGFVSHLWTILVRSHVSLLLHK